MTDTSFVVAVCVAIGAFLAWMIRDSRKSRERMRSYVSSILNLTRSKTLVSNGRSRAVILDAEEEDICLIWLAEGEFTHKRYGFVDIVSCEVVEDGTPIHSVKDLLERATGNSNGRGSAIDIAGLRDSGRFFKKIENIKLRMVVADLERPSHSVTIASSDIRRGSYEHRHAIEIGRQWLDAIAVGQRRLADGLSGSDQHRGPPAVAQQNAPPLAEPI